MLWWLVLFWVGCTFEDYFAIAVQQHGEADFKSKPVAHDSHQEQNRFSKRDVVQMEQIVFGRDASRFNKSIPCHHSIDVAWSMEVGSSVYSTPIITDLFGDGKKEVVLSTFVHYFEVLDGETGADADGWPYTHNDIASHSSVAVHDIDQDGCNELMYSTANAELVFFRDNGDPILGQTLKVPPIKVQKRWYEMAGNTDEVNEKFLQEAEKARKLHREEKWHSEHPGGRNGEGLPVLEVGSLAEKTIRDKEIHLAPPHMQRRQGHGTDVSREELLRLMKETAARGSQTNSDGVKAASPDANLKVGAAAPRAAIPPLQPGSERPHQQLNPEVSAKDLDHTLKEAGAPVDEKAAGVVPRPHSGQRVLQHFDEGGQGDDLVMPHELNEENWDGDWDDGEWHDPYYDGEMGAQKKLGTESALSEEAQASMGLIFSQVASSPEKYLRQVEKDPLASPFFNRSDFVHGTDYVWVDAHLLATPVIADLDLDNSDEVIIPVSYYFEKEFYRDPKHADMLPGDVDPDNYVSGGVVVMDITSGQVKWSKQLDLTTNKVRSRAFVYSSPTVVDLDGDGKSEIIQSTSQGFIYVFSHTGQLRRGFPKFMAEIQGQVGVADVDEDGRLDLCAVDFKSNIACFDRDGEDLWDRQLSGVAAQAVSFGDIDGDGHLDIVVGTSTGHVWALLGKTGDTLDNFPVKTGGPIYSPALLINLNNTDNKGDHDAHHPAGLHIVLPSHDGHLYIIDGRSACIDRIDLGENSYSMVLADDLSGNGYMDLVVTTMNGNVYLLNTETKFHPLKAWTSQSQGLNGFTAKEGYVGIMISPESRVHRDVVGDHFKVMFEIVDLRKHQRHDFHQKYHVKVTIGRGVPILSKTYYRPSRYVEIVRTPPERLQGTLYVTMRNEFGQMYEDSMPISFNLRFYNTIRWLVLLPFAMLAVVLMLNKATNQSLSHEPFQDCDDLLGQ
eukprot:GGOE01003776.1.p1 GENE.GGOE01003776.1~~GGOE01003776.1.p1  ORF type:complete len:951 (+),score=255.61 GGOE01003776.1:33-2885(+)